MHVTITQPDGTKIEIKDKDPVVYNVGGPVIADRTPEQKARSAEIMRQLEESDSSLGMGG